MIFVDKGATLWGASKPVLLARLAATDAVNRQRNLEREGAADTSEILLGKRNRAAVGAEENSEELLGNQGIRRRVGDLHSAIEAGEVVVKEHVR